MRREEPRVVFSRTRTGAEGCGQEKDAGTGVSLLEASNLIHFE